MVSAKREDTAAMKGRTKVLSTAHSVAVRPSSTSNALQRITPPLIEIAAQAVIGQDIFIFTCKQQGQEACSSQIKILNLKNQIILFLFSKRKERP